MLTSQLITSDALAYESETQPKASAGDCSSNLTSQANLAGRTLQDIERQAILDTLCACGGNKAKSARMLGISEKSIYNKMRRLGLPLKKVF
jgi:DNA-binding NtrC family response regulator